MKFFLLSIMVLMGTVPAFAASSKQEIVVISLNPESETPRYYVDAPSDLTEVEAERPRSVWRCTVKANGTAIKTFLAYTELGGSNPQGNYNYTTNVPGVRLTTSCTQTMFILSNQQ